MSFWYVIYSADSITKWKDWNFIVLKDSSNSFHFSRYLSILINIYNISMLFPWFYCTGKQGQAQGCDMDSLTRVDSYES